MGKTQLYLLAAQMGFVPCGASACDLNSLGSRLPFSVFWNIDGPFGNVFDPDNLNNDN